MNAFDKNLNLQNYTKINGGIYFLDNMKIQIIKEVEGKNHYDAHNIYNNIRVFNNRQKKWNCNTHSWDQ
jgi:hypothetical protein